MATMDQGSTLPPPPPRADVEFCYRHPAVETGVHCTRCGRPICTDCMIPAPVGHQCPSCVADARREFRQGPGRRIAVAEARGFVGTRLLLVVIAVVFAIEVVVGGPQSLLFGPSPRRLIDLGAENRLLVASGQYWRLFTSMFLHAGILHVLFNGWALYVFGSALERDIGRLRFLGVYLSAGLFASATSYALVWDPSDPAELASVSVGASGAIFGLLGAYLVYNWNRRHQALARARVAQIMQLLLLNLVLTFAISFIDWRAHIGGLVGGIVAGYLVDGRGRDPRTGRLMAALGILGVLAAAVVLVAIGTARIPESIVRQFLG
jgi:membrane associated rhomboid family serine protease